MTQLDRIEKMLEEIHRALLEGDASEGPVIIPKGHESLDRLGRVNRKKAWYVTEDRILAFVNREQTCTLRVYDSRTAMFLGMQFGSGHYGDHFSDVISQAVKVDVPYQPNLDRDCKKQLPDAIINAIRGAIKSEEK